MIPERITIDDIVKSGYCASGARRWFHAHGLDFRDMMANGIRTQDLLATGDALAEKVVAKTQERLADG